MSHRIPEGSLLHGVDRAGFEHNLKHGFVPITPYNGDRQSICFSMIWNKGIHDLISDYLPSSGATQYEKYAFGILPETVECLDQQVVAVGYNFADRFRDFLYPNLSSKIVLDIQHSTCNEEVRLYRPLAIDVCDFVLVATEKYEKRAMSLLEAHGHEISVIQVASIEEEPEYKRFHKITETL